MTDNQEKILEEIGRYSKQKKYLEAAVLKYRFFDHTNIFYFVTESDREIFEDFKAKMQAHYDAQIDSLIAQLSA